MKNTCSSDSWPQLLSLAGAATRIFFVCDKHVFVTTKHIFCRDNIILLRQIFVVTNRILLRQAYFCCNERHVLLFVATKVC